MNQKTIKLLRGYHTVESIAEELNIKKTSALNLISKLRKQGYLKTSGGGKQKRTYKISIKKEQEYKGMYTIINKYSKFKLAPKIKHAAIGNYTIEHALTDAILTNDFRTIHASLYLFNHVKNWARLHKLARKHGIEQETGALYELARTIIKTRKMPENILKSMKKNIKRKILIKGLKTDDNNIKRIEKEWKITLPFAKKDLEELR